MQAARHGVRTASVAPSRRAWSALRAHGVALALVAVSIADLATTAVALSWGAPELSPGGAAVLAVAGVAGLAALKLVALAWVWLLNRAWPAVGRPVGGGLTLMTAAAVTWNLYALGTAGGPPGPIGS